MGTAVLGAGPAGLTAAYVLGLRGVPAAVYEADGTVGGIAKTVEYNGYRFDLGGHRFFTKFAQVAAAVGGDPRRRVPRPPAALAHLLRRQVPRVPAARRATSSRGSASSSPRCARCRTSAAACRPSRHELETFEDWVTTQNFGNRLYDAFFRLVHGEGVGRSRARRSMPSGRRSGSRTSRSGRRCCARCDLSAATPTTLIEEFHYPRLGPGQMWERIQARVAERGIPVQLRPPRAGDPPRATTSSQSVTVEHDGTDDRVPVDAVLSSIALSELVLSLDPAPPERSSRPPSACATARSASSRS